MLVYWMFDMHWGACTLLATHSAMVMNVSRDKCSKTLNYLQLTKHLVLETLTLLLYLKSS